MKELLTTLAIGISLFAYIPYIIDSYKGKTKPHAISWFTWGLISYLAFGIQPSKGGGAGSYINLVMGIICTINFILGLRNGLKDITKADLIAFALAIIAIILWVFVSQPLFSILLVVFIDIMSFIPTFRKSWRKPQEETLLTWLLSIVKNTLNIFALESLTLITVIYPLYSLFATSLFVGILLFRRRALN